MIFLNSQRFVSSVIITVELPAQDLETATIIYSTSTFTCSCSVFVQEESCHFPQERLLAKRKISLPSAQGYASVENWPNLPGHSEGMCSHPRESELKQQRRRISRSWRWTDGGRFPFPSLNPTAWLAFSGVTSFTGTFDTAPLTNSLHKMFYSSLENPSTQT